MFQEDLPNSKTKSGVRQCSSPGLYLISRVPRFAPGYESYPLKILIQHLKDEDVLIGHVDGSGMNEFDQRICTLPLGPVEAGQDSLLNLEWDGRDAEGRLVHPSLSPFRITVIAQAAELSASFDFEVVFAPPQLFLGRLNPAGIELDLDRHIRLRLNELGWYGGPLLANTDGYQEKAIERFRRNHVDLQQDLDAGVPDAFLRKMDDDRGARPWIVGERTRPGDSLDRGVGLEPPPLRVFVESPVYSTNRPLFDAKGEYDPGAVHELNTQYDSPENWKSNVDAARLNRPLVPIECRLPLLSSEGEAVFVPEAIGPVEIEWQWSEPAPDPKDLHDNLPLVRSYPHKFIGRAIRARLGTPRFNCHTDFGGLRSDGSILPFLEGKLYPPYLSILGPQGLRTRVVIGTDDPETCHAMAGVYFRPSIIAGDQYWIKAVVRFTDHPRATELENACYRANQPVVVSEEPTPEVVEIQPGRSVSGTSRRFQVWRHAKVRAVVGWPPRDWGAAWPTIRKEYARSYLDLEPPDLPSLSFAKIVDPKTYEEWRTVMLENFGSMRAMLTTLDPETLLPSPPYDSGSILPHKEATPSEVKFFAQMVMLQFNTELLILKTCRQIQAQYGHGLVIFDRLMIPRDSPFRSNSSEQKSEGLPDGIVLIDQVSDVPLESLATHEIAHCFSLRHAKQVGDSTIGPDHDDADEYCTMRYPDWEQQDETHHLHEKSFRPRFCGMCNLKLRGWRVLADDMPKTSA